ncbi:fumarylacetoacetate hydrolase family protein [Desulfopila aestuarii]|uniref:2-keto-4-pentenoate hydratase/2-oxohepta-3-ene-1,7-dioic acid hydratase (Catechol pathway) n=1 Tax=Desulfopila aestuarii DSM 18488 TaxID=1121416 RepID=A0A1M7XXY6_9BACT|nr:fumarylacetoacetate hydrolase family protein [Desulfopila aestuarii]SHO43821.1 2-keto-4-pentenoate hydratase/2-oxohepta-3-ene-1,7-dioic acid hydratase (catechol pathway) [Desulfopila aestuarii DSM 18488]
MKLVSFNYRNLDRIGVINDKFQVVDLALALPLLNDLPTNMIDYIRLGGDGLALARKALETASSSAIIPDDEVVWQPPVPRPGKICGVALNNSASNSRKISAPEHPAFFLKPASCLVGHGQPLVMRSYYGSMHPEPELAMIIGKKARDVDAADALEYIYGYSIFNDITGNEMRAADLFHYQALYAAKDDPNKIEQREQHLSYAGRYKGTDNFGVLGPWLVTRDEVENPDNLAVTCKVSGETVAEDNTCYYNYKVAEILSFISQFQTLNPGDVISCGTAFKPSANRKSIHQANFLVTGGPVEISIEKLGTQCNPIIVEQRTIGKWRLK